LKLTKRKIEIFACKRRHLRETSTQRKIPEKREEIVGLSRPSFPELTTPKTTRFLGKKEPATEKRMGTLR